MTDSGGIWRIDTLAGNCSVFEGRTRGCRGRSHPAGGLGVFPQEQKLLFPLGGGATGRDAAPQD